MASLSFTFSLSALPSHLQQSFLTRFTELVAEYQMMTAPVPPSPPAESLPAPSFQDGAAVPAALAAEETGSEILKKERKNRWADMPPEEAAVKKAEIAARLKAGREAKKAARAAAALVGVSNPTPARSSKAESLARLSAQANAIQSSFRSAASEARALFEASADKKGRTWSDLSPEEMNAYVVRTWTGGSQ